MAQYTRAYVLRYVPTLKNKPMHQSKVYNSCANEKDKLFVMRIYNEYHLNNRMDNGQYSITPEMRGLLLDYITEQQLGYNPNFDIDSFNIKNDEDIKKAIAMFNQDEADILKMKEKNIYGDLPDFLTPNIYKNNIQELDKEGHLKKVEDLKNIKTDILENLNQNEEDKKRIQEELKNNDLSDIERTSLEQELIDNENKKIDLLIRFDANTRNTKEHLYLANDLEDRLYSDTSTLSAFKQQAGFFKSNRRNLIQDQKDIEAQIRKLEKSGENPELVYQLNKTLDDVKEQIFITETKLARRQEHIDEAQKQFDNTPEGQIKLSNNKIKDIKKQNEIINFAKNNNKTYKKNLENIQSDLDNIKVALTKTDDPKQKKAMQSAIKRLEKEKFQNLSSYSLGVDPKEFLKEVQSRPMTNFEKEYYKELTTKRDVKKLSKNYNDLNNRIESLKEEIKRCPNYKKKELNQQLKNLNSEERHLHYKINLSQSPSKMIEANKKSTIKEEKHQKKMNKKIQKQKIKEAKIKERLKPTKEEKKYEAMLKKHKSKNVLLRGLSYAFNSKERREIELARRKAVLSKLDKQPLLKRLAGKALLHSKSAIKDGITGGVKGTIKKTTFMAFTPIRYTLTGWDKYNKKCNYGLIDKEERAKHIKDWKNCKIRKGLIFTGLLKDVA